MLLHRCGGVVGGKPRRHAPVRTMFSFKNPCSLATFVPRIRRSRVRGFSYFPPVTSHESPVTAVVRGFARHSSLATRHFPRNPSRMRTYGKRWGEGGAPFSNGLRSRVTTCFTRSSQRRVENLDEHVAVKEAFAPGLFEIG